MNRTIIAILAGGALVAAIGSIQVAAEKPVAVPAPKVDQYPENRTDVAVLAGGCFWGMEAAFEQLKGVESVTSGYAGGTGVTANYGAVSSERTRHAEAVRIRYNPSKISYGRLLQVYFSVAHDPTQLNRQGPDRGTSYRSAIFPQNVTQRNIATGYIAQLTKAKSFATPIVTTMETGQFYPAEPEHQDFMRRNPRHPYIVQWDVPKVRALRTMYPNLVK
jgi:peptide-methionine (S)-S-oxide reductase